MVTKFFLIVNSNGSVRVNRTSPKLQGDEISIFLALNLPNKLFEKPFLQADIEIPESVIPSSPLNAIVAANVRDAIKQATDLDFNITVISETKEE